jgi:hypothetical protein
MLSEAATASRVVGEAATASRHLFATAVRFGWQARGIVLPQEAAQDVMELRARLFAIALGIVVLLFVVNLVRTRKLKEEFALLWLLTAVVLVLAPLLIDYLDMIAHALGIEYPPAFIFVLAIICVLLVLFQFSMRISHFSEQIKVLTQELALLRARLEFLERSPPPRDTESRGASVDRNDSAVHEAPCPARPEAGRLAEDATHGTDPATDEEEVDVNRDRDTQA